METLEKAYPPGQTSDDQFTDVSKEESFNFQTNKTIIASKSGIVQITDLPPLVMHLILRNLKFENIARLRLVSKKFNAVCSFLLNNEFNHLRTTILQKFQGIKALMPRRESARRKHPLARESDIIETLHMRLSLLHMTFGKHIERKYCCFFPGEIIDEIYSILQYIKSTPSLNRAYKVTDELFDLSTMAMEYFKECIEPTLPEMSFLTTELLEHSSIIRPSTDLTINKSQLLNLECSSAIQDILVKPTSDHLSKFRKQLKKTKEIATKNKQEIVKIKRSLKTARKRVTAVVKDLQQIKWLQKNDEGNLLTEYSNLNSFLLEVKGQQQEASCSSEPKLHSCEVKASDAITIKSDIVCDKLQEKTPQNIKRALNPFVTSTSIKNEANLANNLITETYKRVSADDVDSCLSSKRKVKKKRV